MGTIWMKRALAATGAALLAGLIMVGPANASTSYSLHPQKPTTLNTGSPGWAPGTYSDPADQLSKVCINAEYKGMTGDHRTWYGASVCVVSGKSGSLKAGAYGVFVDGQACVRTDMLGYNGSGQIVVSAHSVWDQYRHSTCSTF
jgi:hypothetical protein